MKQRHSVRILSGLLVAALLALPVQALSTQDARQLLKEYYIDPVSEDVLNQASIDAMLEKLGDPYTQYFAPEEYQAFLASMEDTDIVGIGVVSLSGNDGIIITAVLPGSPAEHSGLKADDIIVAVDGKSTVGVDATLVSTWIQGEVGTRVEVAYLRDGQRHTITLTRSAITVPATSFHLVDGHIGYIDCTAFGFDTLGHFQDAVNTNNSVADHWVVDLRGNGGGMTQAAVQSIGVFTGADNMGYLRNRAGEYSLFTQEDDALTMAPLITLSDGHTASASELFSACVRDLEAGIVVGGRTYGKGVAQSLVDQTLRPDLFSDGSAMKITSFRYFSPNGTTTDTVGVVPHLLVPADIAGQVAELLSATAPTSDTSGYYRLDLVRRWYIDKQMVRQPKYQAAFEQLLSAIPPTAAVKLWSGTGGTEWKSITPEALAAEVGITYLDRSFTDVEKSPYAQSIDLLATYGILSGTGDGTYQPEQMLTRAQLSMLLAQALNCNVPSGDSAFSDVSMDAWYGPAVNALAKMGLVSGVGGGYFAPDAPVTHEQFISIMARLAAHLNLNFYEALNQMPGNVLNDGSLSFFSKWAREGTWLLSLSQHGLFGNTINLLWSDLKDISAQGTTSREEAAALLYQVLSFGGVLPV